MRTSKFSPFPAGIRGTYDAIFASSIKTALTFGVRGIGQLRQQVHANGYQRVRVEQMLRCA